LILEGDVWGNIVNVSRHDSDSRWLPLRRHPDTSVEYDGDNPLRLAEEIDAALDKYGLGNNRRMFTRIKFFEGELCLIADCLRCAGPQKVVQQPRGALNFEGPQMKKSMPGWSAGSLERELARLELLSAITALGFALLSDNALAQQAADVGPVVGTETTVLTSMLDYDHSRLEYRN
jgi:hypothetical protein